MRQLLTEVVKDLQLIFQLQEVHVLVPRVWHFVREETVRIYLEMSRQFLNPLLVRARFRDRMRFCQAMAS